MSLLEQEIIDEKLYQETCFGNTEKVQVLLAEKADPNSKNYEGQTALIVAACKGHTEIVQALLTAQANPNAQDYTHNTAIYYAVNNRHAGVIQQLCKVIGHDWMDSALSRAVESGYTEIAVAIINAQNDLNAKTVYRQKTLMYAVMFSRPEVLQVLLNDQAINNLDMILICLDKISRCLFRNKARQLLDHYIDLQKQITEITQDKLKEIVTEIITNDFSMLLKPLLSHEVASFVDSDQELKSLVIPDGFVVRLLREYKERFIILRAIFKFPEARQDQEVKTWDHLPLELINELVLHQIE